MNNKRQVLLIVFIVLGVLIRLLPHPPNFTPILGIALFGGTMFTNKWLAVLVPLITMFISDVYIGFYPISFWVYGSLGVIGVLATYWKAINIKNVLLSSVIFFIVTNFGVWVMGGYPKDITGLILCYTMAIPFFTNTIAGTLFFSYLLKWTFTYCENKLTYIHV